MQLGYTLARVALLCITTHLMEQRNAVIVNQVITIMLPAVQNVIVVLKSLHVIVLEDN